MGWIILAVVFWGFFHSFNASHGVKDFWRRMLGVGFMKYYRLAYNVFAVITFLPILLALLLLPDGTLYRVPAPWSYGMIAGQVFFAACLLAAVFQFGILYFIGLRQLAEKPGDGNRHLRFVWFCAPSVLHFSPVPLADSWSRSTCWWYMSV
jgi:hypothetical protein